MVSAPVPSRAAFAPMQRRSSWAGRAHLFWTRPDRFETGRNGAKRLCKIRKKRLRVKRRTLHGDYRGPVCKA
jgi:hypothetical protein